MNAPLSARRITDLLADPAGAAASATATGAVTTAPLRALLEVVEETGSTNADLMARLSQLQSPVLRVAENQVAGRGRAGRPWHSVPGAALMFSLAWPFQRKLAELLGLPLAVGVAVAETLAGFGISAQLKWPNDVLLDGAKLAGVLIETAVTGGDGTNRERTTWAVIGIGINVALPETLRAEIGRPVAHMTVAMDRDALMARLWRALESTLERFEQRGFAAFVSRWNQLDAYAGQMVTIIDQGRIVHQGLAAGVDDIGRLRLKAGQIAGQDAGQDKQTDQNGEQDNAEVLVVAGDVSLRVLQES